MLINFRSNPCVICVIQASWLFSSGGSKGAVLMLLMAGLFIVSGRSCRSGDSRINIQCSHFRLPKKQIGKGVKTKHMMRKDSKGGTCTVPDQWCWHYMMLVFLCFGFGTSCLLEEWHLRWCSSIIAWYLCGPFLTLQYSLWSWLNTPCTDSTPCSPIRPNPTFHVFIQLIMWSSRMCIFTVTVAFGKLSVAPRKGVDVYF